ncbi:hypothetical protein P3T42_007183 [Paraburkholderia sp. GAS38]
MRNDRPSQRLRCYAGDVKAGPLTVRESLTAIEKNEPMPMKPALIPFAIALASAALSAYATPEVLTIQVDQGVTARVQQAEDAVLVRFTPSGKTQRLKIDNSDDDAHYRLEVNDFNFDGHQDFASVSSIDGVDESYQVFLYDPKGQQFVPLEPKRNAKAGGNCDGLFGVTLNKQTHTLYSACRGAGWYVDAYRYGTDGRLYLYEATQSLDDDDLQKLLGKNAAQGDVPEDLLRTYDEQGNVVSRRLRSRSDPDDKQVPVIHVSVERLPLHATPTENPTPRYLVRGDAVEVVDVSDDAQWLKVAYRNPHKGTINGWVSVADAAGEPRHQ